MITHYLQIRSLRGRACFLPLFLLALSNRMAAMAMCLWPYGESQLSQLFHLFLYEVPHERVTLLNLQLAAVTRVGPRKTSIKTTQPKEL